jgi:hypothetical protein
MGGRRGALLLATRSVHGFWVGEPLWVVALDADLVVTHLRVLRRRRIVTVGKARWILELPMARLPPPVGLRLTWRPESGEPRLR